MKLFPPDFELFILSFLMGLALANGEECKTSEEFNFFNCHCTNTSVGLDRPVVNVYCRRPLLDFGSRIILPEMKYTVLNQLVLAEIIRYETKSQGSVHRQAPQASNQHAWRYTEVPYWMTTEGWQHWGTKDRRQPWAYSTDRPAQEPWDGTTTSPIQELSDKIILPRITDFRVREMIIRNAYISTNFLRDRNYFAEQGDFLTYFTMNRCYINGVLTRGDRNSVDAIETAAFDALPNLEYLDLSENEISKIKAQAFKFAFPNLKQLHLKKNKISEIESTAFFTLTALETLDLSNNKLTHIKADIFPKIDSSLKYINFRNNEIIELSGGLFEGLKFLEKIDLKFNFIQHLPREMWMSNSLRHSDFSGNFISCNCNTTRRLNNCLRVDGLCMQPVSHIGVPINHYFKSMCQTSNEIKNVYNCV